MKIKQVCALTGLTSKAVRFYTEKGLLPRAEDKAYGRTLREYTADDVRTLQDIVTLRESGFSVQEILTMQQSPTAVEPLALARARALQEELDIGRMALQRLNTETGRTGDWHNLARHLRPTGASPQAEPDFSNLYDEEEQILLMEAEPPKPKRKILRACTVLFLLFLCLIAAKTLHTVYKQFEPVSIVFLESEVQFTSLQHDKVTMIHKGEYPPMTNLFNREQRVLVDNVDTDSLFKNTTYCCVTLQIEMPRHEAANRGLLNDQGQLCLENIEYYMQIQKYITLVDVHAG